MSYSDDLIKLRKRIADAVKLGFVDSDKTNFEAVLIQIMNEAEKHRQTCVSQADNLRKQAAALDGQAQGFASVSSIVYSVINSYVALMEKEKEREEELKNQTE